MVQVILLPEWPRIKEEAREHVSSEALRFDVFYFSGDGRIDLKIDC